MIWYISYFDKVLCEIPPSPVPGNPSFLVFMQAGLRSSSKLLSLYTALQDHFNLCALEHMRMYVRQQKSAPLFICKPVVITGHSSPVKHGNVKVPCMCIKRYNVWCTVERLNSQVWDSQQVFSTCLFTFWNQESKTRGPPWTSSSNFILMFKGLGIFYRPRVPNSFDRK